MHFDVVFLDDVSTKYYDRITLEKQGMGGTEASVVRIAEGLAALRIPGQKPLTIAVIQCLVPYFPPILGQNPNIFYLHVDDLPGVSCKHFIQMRGVSQSQMFPKAKHYVWLHDLGNERIKEWIPTLTAHNTTLIAVSKWHEDNIKQFIPDYPNLTYIYNSVQDDIYVSKDTPLSYDRNTIIWTSSPHKGLGKALELFKQIRTSNPKMTLIVCNPGYLGLDTNNLATIPGVSVYGAMACKNLWSVIQKSMCVFYPCQFDETFGLVAAEANALGTPVATYRKAALKETVSSDLQTVECSDEAGLVQKVLDWSLNGRPTVLGKDEFRHSNVIVEWLKILAG